MPALDTMLSYRLHLLHKLTDLESQRAYLSEARLTLADGRCLAAIGAFAPLSVNELAQRANLTKGQASRAAQWLVEQALVDKSASPSDSRGPPRRPMKAGPSSPSSISASDLRVSSAASTSSRRAGIAWV